MQVWTSIKECFVKKNSLSITFFTLLLFVVGIGVPFAAWDGKSTEKPSTETIDKKDFYIIKNEANLAWFRDSVNKAKGTITINAKLTTSLDMGGKLFVPIAVGSGSIVFGGIFDGNGHSISNLYLNSDELGKIPNEFCPQNKPQCNAQNVGFVGVLSENGIVKNLNLENVNIMASTNRGESGGEENPVSVGPFVGFQRGGTVENCFVSGSILTSGRGNGIGGLVGNAWNGKITNSLSAVDIWVSGDDSYVGGIAGYARNTGKVTIEACVYDGSILINSGNGVAGGAVGYFEAGELSASKVYFDSDIAETGLGKIGEGLSMDGSTASVKNINIEKVVCDLNGGQWSGTECSKSGIWSIGAAHIVHNGMTLDAAGNVVYEVLFNANTGNFSSNARFKKYLKIGDLITSDEISIPVHGDTVFGGWALTPDATGPAENLGTVDGSTTIYAYWKTMHQISFNATSQGIFRNDPPSQIMQKLVAEGEPIDVNGIGLPWYTNDGPAFYFAGWAKTENATEALNDLGTATDNATFYAVWVEAPTYAVIFNTHKNGASVVYIQENEQQDQTVARPSDPIAEGYEFVDWFTTEDGDETFDFGKVITDNTEIHAKWTPVDFAITYDLDGGKNNSKNPSSYNIESENIELKYPTKTGYAFEGWFYDNKYTNKATQILKGSSGNKNFYAKWTPRIYKITYMAGSYGAEVIPAEYKEYDKSIALKGAVYTRKGYIQKGWAKSNGGKKVYELGAKYSTNASLTLYPYWEADPASVRRVATNRLGTFSVAVQNRSLDISGAKAGAKWAVFDMQGSLVAQGIAQSGSTRVEISKAGTYIVRMDSQFRTVRIR